MKLTYKVKTIDDISKIPEQHIEEFFEDLKKSVTEIRLIKKQFGIFSNFVRLGPIEFTPNGKGEVSFEFYEA